MTTETLLKVSDVAKVLNIGRTKAYELARERKLPVVKIDGCIRIRHEDLQRYIEEQTENLGFSLESDNYKN